MSTERPLAWLLALLVIAVAALAYAPPDATLPRSLVVVGLVAVAAAPLALVFGRLLLGRGGTRGWS